MLKFYYFFKNIIHSLKFIFLVISIFFIKFYSLLVIYNSIRKRIGRHVTKCRIIRRFNLNSISFAGIYFFFLTLNYLKFKVIRIKKSVPYMVISLIEDASCLHFPDQWDYLKFRAIWAYNYHYKTRKDTAILNLKHIFNRPASKTWDLEEYRESEWQFVSESPFINSIEDIWEFDYGVAEHSWNVVMYQKPVDYFMEFYGSEEEQLDELAEPLLRDNYTINLFTSQLSLFEEF